MSLWQCLIALAAIGLIAHASSAIAAEAAALNAALESISSAELKQYIDVLADDTFEGREAGSRGGRAAAGYIVKQLTSLGLKPAGIDGGWFQPFMVNHRNILALVEGGDPELKGQYLVISAHYDHVGYGSPRNSYGPLGYIHNGADDNASGVAGLLELAQAVMLLPERPKRSLLFAFWDGEEQGLYGSKHWATNPTIPLKNVPLAINIDMIGRLRNQRLEISGTRTTYGLRRIVSQQNDGEFLLDFTWEMKANSDHWSFYERDVPVLLLHTGLHGDYHRPSDDVDKINKEGLQQVSRLLLRLTLQLADADHLAAFRPGVRHEPNTRKALEQSLPPLRPRLGIVWDDKGSAEAGWTITQVVAGSPAAQAGLRVGDKLLTVGGAPIENGGQLRQAAFATSGSLALTFKRAGKEEPQELSVPLAGQPLRIGIAWREDDAEPGTVILSRVAPGSPAAMVDLRVGDRIYQVAGQNFAKGTEFLERLSTSENPVEILAERQGKTFKVAMTLPPPMSAEATNAD